MKALDPPAVSSSNKRRFSSEKDFIWFLVKLALIWLSWKAIFYVLGEEKTPLEERIFPILSGLWEQLNEFNVTMLLYASQWILEGMGFQTEITGRSIWVEGVHAVGVGNYCLGFQLIYYFSALVLIAKVSTTKKATALLFGMAITQCLNIIRISGLSILVLHKPEWTHFFHDHVFNVMVFGVMILYYFKVLVKAEAR